MLLEGRGGDGWGEQRLVGVGDFVEVYDPKKPQVSVWSWESLGRREGL